MNEDELKKILGYDIVQKEVKKYILDNPKTKVEIEEWLTVNLGKGYLKGIRICNLHYLDYDMDLDELDDFELEEFKKKAKHNMKVCPSHKTCPIFLNNNIEKNEKCITELVETKFLINGLIKELDVKIEDFNDQILISQLVSLNILYNRALESISATSLVSEIKTYQKGIVKIEEKANVNFEIADRTLILMEKLRKSLILNREDKNKIKKGKTIKTESEVRKKIEERMKIINEKTSMNPNLIEKIVNEDIPKKIKETIGKNNNIENIENMEIEDID